MSQNGSLHSPMGSLTGPAKLAAVSNILAELRKDVENPTLSPSKRDALLDELKIYGRDPRNADPIFTHEGVGTLANHAFRSTAPNTARCALRCLCNALLLKAETRQMLVDVDIKRAPEDMPIEAKMCASVRTDNPEDEFLAARLLFLTTYGTTLDLNSLIEKQDLPGILTKNLERHATALTASKPAPETSMPEMAMAETLKLLFNVTHFCKDKVSSFTAAIQPIITLLSNVHINPGKPLEPRVSCMVNALLNLDLGAEEVRSVLYPAENPMALAQRLIDLLGLASKAYKDAELEPVAALVGVIRAVHGYAPEDVRQSIRKKLLPTEADRDEVLGRSGTLTSWLLKNSINPVTPQLREAISDLFFEMSDKDPSVFVDNVGYGFASGFLANRNLSVPENAMGGSLGSGGQGRPVNPVTGQFLDRERHPDVPEMSEEEKEREAEKLFVLFERLRKNGVISAENPVRTAQQSGRFEELPDDYEDELD